MKTSGLHINNTLYLLTERLEAKYFYLPHGPLSRVELGKKSIQGLDYAYTLQGWLKNINGFRNDITSTNVYDIGKDGSATNFTNKRFGKDGFATMLQYYTGDYNPINGNNYFNLVSPNSVGLYNGNISALSLGIDTLNPMLKSFRYDKLNRIKMMESAYLSNNIWGVLSNRFGTEYKYDFNGNITYLKRNDQNGGLLHEIDYYYWRSERNRLRSIEVTGTEIISSSYHYDALGNLIEDDAEGIEVDWNVIGKVRFVQTPNNMLRFAYNPFGQRQIKRTDNDSTYYIHDATGNVMGIYVKDDLTITAKERPIYGTSRLGIMNKAVVFNMTGGLVSKSNSTIGIKEYELSDHLGNVSVVVLDRKKSLSTNIQPIIKSHTDYYPFGYPISFRTDNFNYRYGFNGQEGDNEIYGDKLNYAFQYRMYDARIGRFWSVDPLNMKFAYLSTFQFASNNPIWMQELEGLEGKPTSVTGMDYEKLEDNYEKNGQKILNVEGSSLGYLANKNTNTCAIRLSESMNKSGYKVPSSKETPNNVRVQTGNKNDSGNFVLDAKSMSNYLNSIEKPTYKFTKLTTDKDIENAIEIIHKSDDLKGIMVLSTDNVNAYGATGHVDLIYEDFWWDLSVYSYDGYDLIKYLKEHKSINFTLEIWVLEED